MYLIKKVVKSKIAHETSMLSMFGTGFEPDEIARAERLEIWGTNITDPGSDYTEFRLFIGDKQFASRRVDGY